MPDLTLSSAMDAFLAEEDPANVFLPLAGGTMDSGADINFANGSRLREGLTDAGNGGAGGIAMVCSLDYEFKWEAGRLYVMGQDGFTIRVEQFGFTFAPTATDDETKGYVVGSRRILDDGTAYVCTDATTDTAVWEEEVIPSTSDGKANPEVLLKTDSSGYLTVQYLVADYISGAGGFDVGGGSIRLADRNLIYLDGVSEISMLDWSNTTGAGALGEGLSFDQGSLKTDGTGGLIWSNGAQLLVNGAYPEVQFAFQGANRAYFGMPIWAEEGFIDTNQAAAISTESRQLIAADGLTPVLDWSSGYLDVNTNPIVGVYSIRNTLDQEFINGDARGLYDVYGFTSVDWGNRQLIGSDGYAIFDWSGSLGGYLNALEHGILNLYSISAVGGLDCYLPTSGGNLLTETTGVPYMGATANVDLGAYNLTAYSLQADALRADYISDEAGSDLAIDVANRQLLASDGITVAADWSSGTPAFAQGASYTPTAYASLPATPAEGTVCYVNDADSPFSLGSVVTSGGTGKILACFDGTNWRIIAHFA